MRLFLAVNLPPDLRQAAWEAAAPLRQRGYPVKWVAAEALHITVKFLGEVAPHRVHDVVAALEAAASGARRFALWVSGFGAFPNERHPRVVWLGCEAAAPLELLQHRVEQEMDRIGFALEGRPFRPHITLGRVRREAHQREFTGFSEDLAALQYSSEAVIESLDLMESTLTPKGARYTVRHAALFSV